MTARFAFGSIIAAVMRGQAALMSTPRRPYLLVADMFRMQLLLSGT